jgi:Phage portal protein
MAVSSFKNQMAETMSQALVVIDEGRKKLEPQRQGFAVGIPRGGSTEYNQVDAMGQINRADFMDQMLNAYLTCTWSSACVDVIAATATAGGLEVVPLTGVYSEDTPPDPTSEVKRVQDLLRYVNPQNDIRQLMRGVITDLHVFGDSFTEVVYSRFGEPVALYPLDPTTITILADEHGIVKGYYQKTKTNREAYFQPREVIHVKFDTPGDTLYGVSPTQKLILPITTWLFTGALIKETMKRGDPVRLHVDWPIALPTSEMERLQQQYHVRNLGTANIGNPFETKGGAKVTELGANQIEMWMDNLDKRRDEITGGYGVPPSMVGIIEAGNIGGGTGTSQFKTFRTNKVGPTQELVLEKFTFVLLQQCYGVTDWILKFGVVDWSDDLVIEQIRDLRIRNGTWTLNKARADIGQPPVDGGNDPVLIDRQNMVLWQDLNDLSKANLAIAVAAGSQDGTGAPNPKPGPKPSSTNSNKGVNAAKGPNTNPGAKAVKTVKPGGQRATSQKAPEAPKGTESLDEDDDDDEYTAIDAYRDHIRDFYRG